MELYKPRGRKVELAVEPGTYEVRVGARQGVARRAHRGRGRRARGARSDGSSAWRRPEPTRRRGAELSQPRFAVSGRNRLEIVTGMWRNRATIRRYVTAGTTADVLGGPRLHALRPRGSGGDVLRWTGVAVQDGATVSGMAVGRRHRSAAAGLFGIRWNPFKGDSRDRPSKPFVAAAAGPIFGLAEGSFVAPGTISSTDTVRTTFGGHLGGGVDVHVARSFSIGLDAGYHGMLDFSQPVGLRDNFNGPHVTVSFGWLFGKGD